MKLSKEHNEKLLMLLEEYYRESEYISYVDRRIQIKEDITEVDAIALQHNTIDEWLIEEVILPAIKSAIIKQELPKLIAPWINE